jgi:hypothetical protein
VAGGDKLELVWVVAHARSRIHREEIDRPLIERLLEIDLDEAEGLTASLQVAREFECLGDRHLD